MFDAFKKYMKQYIQDPAAKALKKATKVSAETKYINSSDSEEDKALDYALGLCKDNDKASGNGFYQWL